MIQPIAQQLRAARHAAQLTQLDVALALGLARSAISMIEHGHRVVSGPEIEAFARIYRVSVEQLRGEASDPERRWAAGAK